MEKQANRIPCESLDFVEASHRHRVYPLMYCHMEIIGHLDIERLKQSVSLSSEIVPEILCAYDFKKNCFVDFGYTADDVVRYATENMTSALQQDLDSHPQFQIFIIPQKDCELVIAVMSHILADGEGFLQYLYLLAELYNGKQQNKNIENHRDISPLLKNIHVLAPTEQVKRHKHLSISPLRPVETGNQFLCLTSQISSRDVELIHQKARKSGVTMNDVFMNAYARVIAKLQNINTVVLPCPADLRRFYPELDALTIANMTGIYRRITVEIPLGCSFGMTLQQVHIELALQKSRYHCFVGIKALDKVFRKVPHHLVGRVIKAAYRLAPVSYTNFGIISHEKLCFANCTIQNCFLTGTYRHPPDFQLTISTFKNRCTLNCTLIGSVDSERTGQHILELVKQEIFNWIARW